MAHVALLIWVLRWALFWLHIGRVKIWYRHKQKQVPVDAAQYILNFKIDCQIVMGLRSQAFLEVYGCDKGNSFQ